MIKNLIAIQNELKAPKSNYNSFGKYKYRSAENILEAVKPLLQKYGCQMTITDDVIAVGSRVYIKAVVTITDSEGNSATVSALAREDESKKGMDGSQITGTASSYARKYALNGLFLIDDTKDADTDEYHNQTTRAKKDSQPEPEPNIYSKDYLAKHGNERISKEQIDELTKACEAASGNFSLDKAIEACRRKSDEEITVIQFVSLMNTLRRAA